MDNIRVVNIPLISTEHSMFANYASWQQQSEGPQKNAKTGSITHFHHFFRDTKHQMTITVERGEVLVFGHGGDTMRCRALPSVHEYRAFKAHCSGKILVNINTWLAYDNFDQSQKITGLEERDSKEIFGIELLPNSSLPILEVEAPIWTFKPLPE